MIKFYNIGPCSHASSGLTILVPMASSSSSSSSSSVSAASAWRRDIQYNGTQHNYTQNHHKNMTLGTKRMLGVDIQSVLYCVLLCWMSLCEVSCWVSFTLCIIKLTVVLLCVIMLSVIILSGVMPSVNYAERRLCQVSLSWVSIVLNVVYA